ncbi:MAG: MFS transporter [Myxococcales bacterium]|nr:MFS transporter [Myxococcales bacterium]
MGTAVSPVPEAPVTAPTRSEVLSLGQRFAFSAQGFFGACMGLMVAVYLGKFYIDVMLLPAGLYAITVAAGRALDAITDPMMGHISDHTRSRWGRRKPWIFAGVLGWGVTCYLMLTPARGASVELVMWWFTLTYLGHFIFQTMASVPRNALGAELTLDTTQRVRLYGMLAFFVAPGTVVAAAMPGVLSNGFGLRDEHRQMALLGVVYVAGYVVMNMWMLRRLRERREFMGRGETPFVPGVRRALRNRPFRIMFISQVVTAIPVAIPATLVPFFVQYVLKVPENERMKWTSILIVTYLMAGFLALPLWIALAQRWGKLRVWLINGFVGVSGSTLVFFAGEGDQVMVALLWCYVGVQSQIWLVLSGSMHADVIDYDELHTGKRREAQFSALWGIIPKFTMIPGAAIPLAVLGGVGYVPNEPDQAPEVLLTLRIIFALVPAFFNLIGFAIMWFYPLSEENHRKIREGVGAHAAGRDALDPITGAILPPPGRRAVPEDTAWFLDVFSRRELRAYAERGRAPLMSVVGWCAFSCGLCVAAVFFAVTRIPGFDSDPGPLPALSIVVAGLSLTALFFHALRLRPAMRLRSEPVERELVQRHLAALA